MWVLLVVGMLVFVAASGLFSGAETGLYCANRVRLRLARDRGDARAIRLQRVLDDEQTALSVMLVGTNLANYLTTVFAALLLSTQLEVSDGAVEVYATLIVTPLLFVFGEVVPKTLFQRDADRLLPFCGLPLLMAKRLFAPLVWCIRIVSSQLLRVTGVEDDRHQSVDRRHHVAELLREGLAGGEHAGQHLEFVDRVMHLPDQTVGEIMVPSQRVATLPAHTDRAAFLRFARENVYSRVPVTEVVASGDLRVVGLVHVYALLADETWTQVGQRAQPVKQISPADSVASAIVAVQRSSQPMAVVATQDRALLGVVTLKDLLEEIVGELAAW